MKKAEKLIDFIRISPAAVEAVAECFFDWVKHLPLDLRRKVLKPYERLYLETPLPETCYCRDLGGNDSDYCYGCKQFVCHHCASKWHRGPMDPNVPERSHRQEWRGKLFATTLKKINKVKKRKCQ